MFQKVRSFSIRGVAVTSFFFAVFGAAQAQQRMVEETIPNTIKFVGAFKTEAVIEADVIYERSPCKPRFPQVSIRNGETGTVKLQLLINVNGYISRAKVVETSGFRDLDRAAMVGFLGCKFEPPLKNGLPTERWVDMEYAWKID